jgi:hypothetical protein
MNADADFFRVQCWYTITAGIPRRGIVNAGEGLSEDQGRQY